MNTLTVKEQNIVIDALRAYQLNSMGDPEMWGIIDKICGKIKQNQSQDIRQTLSDNAIKDMTKEVDTLDDDYPPRKPLGNLDPPEPGDVVAEVNCLPVQPPQCELNNDEIEQLCSEPMTKEDKEALDELNRKTLDRIRDLPESPQLAFKKIKELLEMAKKDGTVHLFYVGGTPWALDVSPGGDLGQIYNKYLLYCLKRDNMITGRAERKS